MDHTYIVAISEIVQGAAHSRGMFVFTTSSPGDPKAEIAAWLDAEVWPDLDAGAPGRDHSVDYHVDYIKMNRL